MILEKLLMLKIFAQEKPDNCESGCAINLPSPDAGSDQLQSLLAIVFGIAGALAVLSILIAAFNLVTGGGEPEKISRAKNTIIFSLVGLAIAVSAETIVLTVLDKV